MGVKIWAAAKARIFEIWEYTEKKWNEEQADKYVRNLVDAINELPSQRQRWRPVRDKVLSGTFFVRFQRHYVFFREFSKGSIGVISILHENMDIPARLKEDLKRSEEA